MKNYILTRKSFIKNTGLITTASILSPSLSMFLTNEKSQHDTIRNITISTDFISGGGLVSILQMDPVIFTLQPHNQKNGGWSQVWWYFKAEGIVPGEEIAIQVEIGEPKLQGISPQVQFSYDQQDWGLTNSGELIHVNGREIFLYRHVVKNNKVWFAYDLPYTPDYMEQYLFSASYRKKNVRVFELCKSLNNRPVKGLKFFNPDTSSTKYGIWLQARAHAFESGSSWVLHKLAEWLMSEDEKAIALRECSDITIIPIIDVDGVVEGRTGKLQPPNDHNRGWSENPSYWPEVQETQRRISDLSSQNMADMFIDFHGPGNQSHPYFIVPDKEGLPYEKQRSNRAKFFEVLGAKPLTTEMAQSQSMTQIAYSARPWTRISKDNSATWVTFNSSENIISATIEVNMNTPFSTKEGYQAEAIVLGQAISDYFTGGYHKK